MKNPVEDLCFRCDWCANMHPEKFAVVLSNGETICIPCADSTGVARENFNDEDIPE